MATNDEEVPTKMARLTPQAGVLLASSIREIKAFGLMKVHNITI
jgi:hypothetical protein